MTMSSSGFSDPSSAFWPAVQCLTVLMETVGPKLWCFFTRKPDDLFKIITEHPAYRSELDAWIKRLETEQRDPGARSSVGFSESDEDAASNSQQQSCGRPQRRTTFAWLVPLLQSILDYSDSTTCICVAKIIDFLHYTLGKNELDRSFSTLI